MSAHRFVLVESAAPYNPTPSARRRFRWMLPVPFGKPDRALAAHVCHCIFATTPRMTINGVRVALVSATP